MLVGTLTIYLFLEYGSLMDKKFVLYREMAARNSIDQILYLATIAS